MPKLLKEYLCPDFKFIEVRTDRRYCVGVELSARGNNTKIGDGEVDEFDAAPYRGLWDEESTEKSGDESGIW